MSCVNPAAACTCLPPTYCRGSRISLSSWSIPLWHGALVPTALTSPSTSSNRTVRVGSTSHVDSISAHLHHAFQKSMLAPLRPTRLMSTARSHNPSSQAVDVHLLPRSHRHGLLAHVSLLVAVRAWGKQDRVAISFLQDAFFKSLRTRDLLVVLHTALDARPSRNLYRAADPGPKNRIRTM